MRQAGSRSNKQEFINNIQANGYSHNWDNNKHVTPESTWSLGGVQGCVTAGFSGARKGPARVVPYGRETSVERTQDTLELD